MSNITKKRAKVVETDLRKLLRACTDEQRERIAREAGTSVGYLYGIAGCHRQKIGVSLAIGIEDASVALNKESGGEIPVVTVRQLANMCAIAPFAQA